MREQTSKPSIPGIMTSRTTRSIFSALRRERAAAERLAVTFVEGDAEALPFPDAYFDAVTMAFGLRNVTDKPAALAEMRAQPLANALGKN